MGKPFQSELDQLADTYAWAMSSPIGTIASRLRTYRGFPLVCVGSGGSLTTAHFAAALHLEFAGRVSRAMTPLEATSACIDWKMAGAMLFTAGGGNPDVVGCFRQLARQDVARLGVICCRDGGRILCEADRHSSVDQFLIEPPSGKDGFLATNTLLASVVVLSRAFAEAAGRPILLPAALSDYFAECSAKDYQAVAHHTYRGILERDTLVVLHGPATQPAAADLESKFVEAALGNIQIADYRNFAHGRHHWLAKRTDSTGVLAIIGDADRNLAEQTLDLLPNRIPTVRMTVTGTGPAAAIGALVRGYYLTAVAGDCRGVDPGDPGVPTFGRRIYHLNPYPGRRAAETEVTPGAAAIERKTHTRLADLTASGLLSYWSETYAAIMGHFGTARFGAVVFDYDGTLCDAADRSTGIRPEIAERLGRLIDAGIPVGVATGRGRSVGDALRATVPEAHWAHITVGYYNGASVGPLSDSLLPDISSPPDETLSILHDIFARSPAIGGMAALTLRPLQLTLEIRDVAAVPLVWRVVLSVCNAAGRVRPVLSSHSIDVLAPGVTKMSVVERVAAGLKSGSDVLCIGDRGEWPGNDYELLGRPLSLSVDEPSPAPDAGWNLAPPGVRGAAATAYYLDRMRPGRGSLRIRF